MDENLERLLEHAIIKPDELHQYKLFRSTATRKLLNKVKDAMFMELPLTLEPQALAFKQGRMDFVREVLQNLDDIDRHLKTGGDVCQNYLPTQE